MYILTRKQIYRSFSMTEIIYERIIFYQHIPKPKSLILFKKMFDLQMIRYEIKSLSLGFINSQNLVILS